MVGRLSLIVQHLVCGHHVVDDAALGDLLGPELLRRGQVLAVVVAQVVVADDALGLDAGVDQEVDEDGLELGLSGLEVVSADEDAVALGQLHAAGHERVLRRSVQVRTLKKSNNNINILESRNGRSNVRKIMKTEDQMLSKSGNSNSNSNSNNS